MDTIDASRVSATQLAVLESACGSLPEGPLRGALENMSAQLRDGKAVLVLGARASFTPKQAAGLLGISRTHFYKVLDSGALPFHVVGTRDRRVLATDLAEYREKMLHAQKSLATYLARADEMDDLALDEMD